MKKLFNIIALTVLSFLLLSGTSVYALSINIWDTATQQGQINYWKTSLGGNEVVLEDFSSYNEAWYTKINSTNLGTFYADVQGSVGTGDTSYNVMNETDSKTPYFRIATGENYGRDGDHYLDSADITSIYLEIDLDKSLTNLFFYIMDPSDINATTTVSSAGISSSISPYQENGHMFFVGISADEINEFISSVSWSTNGSTNDGYGLDDFSTVNPVPEPATMILFGLGLIGMAGISRRKAK